MHEQPLLYSSQQVSKQITQEELYKTDVKVLLGAMCSEYKKQVLRKEQWSANLNILYCFGCSWDKQAYDEAQSFRPYLVWHLKDERRNLKKLLSEAKEEKAQIARACNLFIEAAKLGREREWDWCFPFLCFCSNPGGLPVWEEQTKQLIQPFEDLKTLVESLGKK